MMVKLILCLEPINPEMAVCLWENSLRNLQKKLHNNASTLNFSVSFQQNQPIPKPRNLANIKRLCEGDMQKPHTKICCCILGMLGLGSIRN